MTSQNTERAKALLTRLAKRFRLLKATESLLLSAGVAMLPALPFMWFSASGPLWLLVLMLFGLVSAVLLGRAAWHRAGEAEMARYLDRRFPELENSSQLLLQPANGLLPRLQQQKVAGQLLQVAEKVKFPHKILPAAGLFAAGLLSLSLAVQVPVNSAAPVQSQPLALAKAPAFAVVNAVAAPVLETALVTIAPPAYTALPPVRDNELHIEAPEGSRLSWEFNFNPAPARAVLVFHTGDTLELRGGATRQASATLVEKGFYSLQYFDAKGNRYESEFFQLQPVPDQPPFITLGGFRTFTEVDFPRQKSFSIAPQMQDDYGLESAWIVATVSKGEGESVKFREERLLFDQPVSPDSKEFAPRKTIDLQQLGMEPGDELYFYVAARDNRQPDPQTARTEMFYVSLPSTEKKQGISLEGIAVDRMPEFFRSQRQLIIDTERLVADRGKVSEENFKTRSNDIGVDQKILRLRYGQFLGEEFESEIGGDHAHHDHEGHDEDGHHHQEEDDHKHDHDHDHEHDPDHEHWEHQGEEHYEGDGHDHDHPAHKERRSSMKSLHSHEHKQITTNNGAVVPEGYMHIHDNMEEATFVDATVKVQLQAALAQMWEAELRLRTLRPEEALPFEYKALELIKEIQQKSRIYVERIGFEPTPVKVAEKRLTGELDEIENRRQQRQLQPERALPAIRQAAAAIARYRQGEQPFDAGMRQLLQKAGNELARLAIEQPGKYLAPLQQVREVVSGDYPADVLQLVLPEIQAVFWQALPPEPPAPLTPSRQRNPLEELFLQQIGAE